MSRGRIHYKFVSQRDGYYYWRRLGPVMDMPGREEIVSCSVDWFWRKGASA